MTKKELLDYIGGSVYVPELDRNMTLDALSCRRVQNGGLQWEADVFDADRSNHCEYHVGIEGLKPGQSFDDKLQWERAGDKKRREDGQKILRKSRPAGNYRGRR